MNAPVQIAPTPNAGGLPAHLPSTHPAELLRAVVERGAGLDVIEKFLALQERWEATQAKKAYGTAMAKFRQQKITVLRGSEVLQGPLRGALYAKLSDFVNATADGMAAHGLSASWRITKDDKDWIEVACVIAHEDGHTEERRMGGPPDVGGAKNSIQARASTVTYLEKYTLKMALGIAEQDDDDDGNGGPERTQTARNEQPPPPPPDKPKVEKATYDDETFAAKLKNDWKPLVENGDKTPAEIIARVSMRVDLTGAQKKSIHALARQENADA